MAAARQRYRIDLAFHGGNFHGWQRQPGLRTVQGELEDWLTRLLPGDQPIAVTGAGRTDAGVHAGIMSAHFDGPPALCIEDLVHRLNAAAPPDIAIARIVPVESAFHARFSAISKTYQYRLTTHRSPFHRDRTWYVHGTLDMQRAHEAANVIMGTHDFTGFCRAVSKKDNMHCTVTQSVWVQEGNVHLYRIRADRFLHEMVRLLVGTMTDIARGRWNTKHMYRVLESHDVKLCGTAAPPHGLALVEVEYPDGVVRARDFG